MDAFTLLVAVAINIAPQPLAISPDLDAAEKAALVDLDSAVMNAQVFAAMAMPYKYGVSQLPCKAKEMQPQRGWKPVREPAGKVQWVIGPVNRAFWQGIYGVCLVQAPKPKEELDIVERAALECECNGWLPAQ
ncbi:MAG TPA: hypothetical protein VHP62_08375 [Usitatibacter sp.]|nr:hypothetical protein [Usitatibacter sp.]